MNPARWPFPFPPALLSAEHAAAYLGISATTLRAIEELQPRVVGGRRLWLRLDLDAWAASRPTAAERIGEDERRRAEEVFGA